ncbi:MAG: hypothetical protein PHU27_03760 [Salinivirgaceae bacterium]|nr:hypothetical protein [Salinivirgaceae bacterium]MDD4745697.1 hypothetical protein [Salinivirgaceae bacterium]MDY0279662.1 hypothetical protein [Salinivirgaceae bacterium]
MHRLQPFPHYLLHNTITLIPSVSEMMVVYVDADLHREIMLKKTSDNKGEITEVAHFSYSKVKKSLKDKNWQWITDAEMPLVKQDALSSNNRTLFEENKVRNLQVNLLNKNKDAVFICYFTFSEHSPLFGHASELELTMENKTLIANMVSNVLLQYLELYHSQIDATAFISDQFKYNEEQLKHVYLNLETQKENNKVLIKQFCDITLREFSIKNGVNFSYSDLFLNKIFNENPSLTEIKESLEMAMSQLLVMFPADKIITIEPWHLTPNQARIAPKAQSTNDVRYGRTIELLDRLEDAGMRVKQQQMKMTGTTVGMHCDTPISAPAITDALKKHSARIIKLMKLYPDKWALLRSDFRPLQNILDIGMSNSETA